MRLREQTFGRSELLYGTACLFIIAISVAAYFFVDETTNSATYEQLIARVRSIAVLFDASEFDSLTLSEEDLENPAYLALKEKLIDIRVANEDISFAYLMAMQGGVVYFIADSEEPESEDYSPPGQEYGEATDELKSLWQADTSHVLEISEDRWGEWISGLAAIKNERGETIAIFGMDQNAVEHRELFHTQIALILLASIALLALMILLYRLEKREQDLIDLKNDFVSIASHELRTPLSSVRWKLAALKDSPQTPATLQKELTDMHERLRSLIERTTALLHITALDRDIADPEEQTVLDIAPLVEDSVVRAQQAAEEKNIRIITSSIPTPIQVRGGATYIRLVFDNLLTNAIKYSPESSDVEISYTGGDSHTFVIKDHGMGIPPDELARVFTGFHRARNAKASGTLGSGFGLYITKRIVGMLGGRITCESVLTKGTTFTIKLPKGV